VATRLIFPGEVVTSDDLRGLRLREGRFVLFPHPREEYRFVVAKARSILGDVASLAEESLKGYPISREMGVWFILTGEFVTEDPVRIRYKTILRPELISRTTITLEVESWLPPEEILEQYRHAQHQVLGGTPRSLKRKTVTLFEFVNRHKGKSWSELLRAWNEAHSRQPRQRFRDRSHLFTTYTRALEYIAGVKPTRDRNGATNAVGPDSHGWPIYAGKWYLLHEHDDPDGHSYTGTFDSRAHAEADPRRHHSEVLTGEQLVARFTEWTRNQ